MGKKLKPYPGQPSSEWMEVVGVVGDVKHDSPDESPALALVLASIGLYGVISYRVAERTREMGVRAAIGARPIDLIRLVGGRSLALVLVGVVIGGAAGVALARAMEGLLYGVKATDPWTFAVMAAALITVGAVACYLPALRLVFDLVDELAVEEVNDPVAVVFIARVVGHHADGRPLGVEL